MKESGNLVLALKLEDKDLRPDLSSAFIAKVKRNRTQVVLPIFGNKLEEAYETHIKQYRKEGVSAVFIDKKWKTNDGKYILEAIQPRKKRIYQKTV